MVDKIYPGLYKAADTASRNAQQNYIGLNKTYLLLTIAGTASSYFFFEGKILGIAALIIFLCTLAIIIYQAHKRFDKDWYNGRALAESIKTRTWRFIMKAEPYDEKNINEAKQNFIKDLKKIHNQNSDLGKALINNSMLDENINEEMLRIRELNLEQRLDFYLKYRVDEQHNWYYNKAVLNQKLERKWFYILVFFHALVILFLIIQIAYNITKIPTEITIVISGSIVTWIQIKRYQDLATSYSLTAFEISIIKSQKFTAEGTEENFSDYVKNAENAFSREHTQWVARKDN